jgi:hypothetical protein
VDNRRKLTPSPQPLLPSALRPHVLAAGVRAAELDHLEVWGATDKLLTLRLRASGYLRYVPMTPELRELVPPGSHTPPVRPTWQVKEASRRRRAARTGGDGRGGTTRTQTSSATCAPTAARPPARTSERSPST